MTIKKRSLGIKNISTGPLARLKKKELNSFYNKTMAELKGYIFTDSSIQSLIEKAMRHGPIHDELSQVSRSHVATPDIQDKIDACRGYLARVKSTVESIRRLPEEQAQKDYRILNQWMGEVKGFMHKTVRVDQEQAMQTLEEGYDRSSKVPELLEELGVDSAFQKAIELNNQMIALTNVRTHDNSYYQDLRNFSREECIFDLHLLFNAFAIESNIESEEQETYLTLCRTFQKRIREVDALYKARITRNEDDEGEENDFDNGDNQAEEGVGHTPDSEDPADATNIDYAEEESNSADTTEDDNF